MPSPYDGRVRISIAAIEDCPCSHQSRRRDHKTGLPEEADPLKVCQDRRVGLGHSVQFVSGHR